MPISEMEKARMATKPLFSELNSGEIERLAILSEECSEVCQMVSKILRHGFESTNPFDNTHTSNRELLEKEIGDLIYAMQLVVHSDLNEPSVLRAASIKADKIGVYLHHNVPKPLSTMGETSNAE